MCLQVWGSILQGLPPLGRVLFGCLAEQKARTPHPGTLVRDLKVSAGRPVALQVCLTPVSGNMHTQSQPTPASLQRDTSSTGQARQGPSGRPDRQASSSGRQRVATHPRHDPHPADPTAPSQCTLTIFLQERCPRPPRPGGGSRLSEPGPRGDRTPPHDDLWRAPLKAQEAKGLAGLALRLGGAPLTSASLGLALLFRLDQVGRLTDGRKAGGTDGHVGGSWLHGVEA